MEYNHQLCSLGLVNCHEVIWHRNVARALNIFEIIFLPRSNRNWRADVLKTSRFSMAISSKIYQRSRSAYLSSLLEATSSVAGPGFRAAVLMYDSASGHVTVTFQHSAFPIDQETSVRPSGRLPSDLNRIRSLSASDCFTGALLQTKLCTP